MKYDIYIQGQLHKTVDVEFTHAAITQASLDIAAGQVANYDPTRNQEIIVRPSALEKLTEPEAAELFADVPAPEPAPEIATESSPTPAPAPADPVPASEPYADKGSDDTVAATL